MASDFLSFWNNFKNYSIPSDSNLSQLKNSSNVKASVIKLISPFKFNITTNLGRVSLVSWEKFSPGSFVEMRAYSDFSGIKLEPVNIKGQAEIVSLDKPSSLVLEGKLPLILTGRVTDIAELPKYEVNSKFGKFVIESNSSLKLDDLVSVNLKNTDKSFEQNNILQTANDLKHDLLGKSFIKELSKFLNKHPEKTLSGFLAEMENLSDAKSSNLKSQILDYFLEPKKISFENIKNSVKGFLGSSFDDFEKHIELLISQSEQKGTKKQLQDIKSLLSEKADDFLEGVKGQKNLNVLRFAESSRLYFFIPFLGKDFESGEFFFDKGQNKQKENSKKELKAAVRLNMSNLGLIKADLSFSSEKNVRIYVGVENKSVLSLFRSSLSKLEANLRKAGFSEIYILSECVGKETLNVSLVKDLLESSSDNSNGGFNIII